MTTTTTSRRIALCLMAAVVLAGTLLLRSFAADAPPATPAGGSGAFPAVGDPAALPNAHRISATLISGAQPEGDAGFKQLAELGIKTIVSVDGATPDVDAAKKYGLRYVHLPITYSGVTHDEGTRLAKALQELPGPIYVHCHHGKHRSAAALAVACVMNGQLKPEQAEDVLKTFGTGLDYKGLWRDARDAKPLDAKELGALQVSYVERAKIPAMAEAMVEIDETFEDLKLAATSGWRAPSSKPALDPAHEALLLREKLHEIGRTEDLSKRPAQFHTMLSDSETAAQTLETALQAWKPVSTDSGAKAPPTIDAAFKAVTASCAGCHKSYRN